ncbi:carboxy-terminal protease [Roseibium album]|nr:carboxy-terminal protease [Roseibium album]
MRISTLSSKLVVLLVLSVSCAFAKDEKVNEPLAPRFAAVFASEFSEPSAAKAAWDAFGGSVLAKIQDDVYPPVEFELFRDRALEHIRRARKSRSNLSPELLSFVALNGLARKSGRSVAVKIVRDKTTSAPQHFILGSIASENISASKEKMIQEASYHDAAFEFPVPILEIPVLKRDVVSSSLHNALASHSGPIIVDLRGNEGGLLAEVPVLAALFLTPNKTVLVMETKNGVKQKLRTDADTHPIDTVRILLLIDEETNAGALALAAALHEIAGAKIAGTRVQGIVDGIESYVLPPICPPSVKECALRLPTGRLLAPSGSTLEEAIEIDYPVDWEILGTEARVAKKWLSDSN